MRKIIGTSLGSLLIVAVVYAADPPRLVNVQGRLMRVSDSLPEAGVVSVTFRFFNAPTGGGPAYSETLNVALHDGFYSVGLGGSGFPVTLFQSPNLYLEVQAGSTVFSPRQHIVPNASAFESLHTSQLDNLDSSQFLRSDTNPVTFYGEALRIQFGASGGGGRALVHAPGNRLVINASNEFGGGTEVQSALNVQGDLTVGGSLFVGGQPLTSGHVSSLTSGSTNADSLHRHNLVPSGLVAMYPGGCPGGWSEVFALRTRYPKGWDGGTIGRFESSSSHSHGGGFSGAGSHSHGVWTTGANEDSWWWSWQWSVSGVSSTDGAGNHGHGIGFNAAGHEPPFQTVVFCQKN